MDTMLSITISYENIESQGSGVFATQHFEKVKVDLSGKNAIHDAGLVEDYRTTQPHLNHISTFSPLPPLSIVVIVTRFLDSGMEQVS